MDALRSWLAACRPGQALLAPCCVAVGASYARFDAQSSRGLGAGVLVTAGAFAAAIGVHLIDLAWDRLGAPATEAGRPTGAGEAAAGGGAALAIAALCGFGLVGPSGSGPLGYGALAVGLGVLRGAPLIGWDAVGGGLGELAAFLAFGPLAASAGYASQAGTGSWGAVLAGAPAGLVALAALFAGRGHDATLEPADARKIAVSLPLIAAAAVALAVRYGEYGPWANAAAVPLAVAAAASWRREVWRSAILVCVLVALGIIAVALRIAVA
jgi:1,4-dihydroxy-2-naphthoate octaprenyltransferase